MELDELVTLLLISDVSYPLVKSGNIIPDPIRPFIKNIMKTIILLGGIFLAASSLPVLAQNTTPAQMRSSSKLMCALSWMTIAWFATYPEGKDMKKGGWIHVPPKA